MIASVKVAVAFVRFWHLDAGFGGPDSTFKSILACKGSASLISREAGLWTVSCFRLLGVTLESDLVAQLLWVRLYHHYLMLSMILALDFILISIEPSLAGKSSEHFELDSPCYD